MTMVVKTLGNVKIDDQVNTYDSIEEKENDKTVSTELLDVQDVSVKFQNYLTKLNKDIKVLSKRKYPPNKVKKEIGIMVSNIYKDLKKEFPEKIKFIREFSPFIEHNLKNWDIIKYLQNKI